ncbi:MAG: RNA polymerase sigma factor (sigma-70 family) [Paraglaciecola sp.]|jgi:RNA polymerase sigma factor (sigma-70 family)
MQNKRPAQLAMHNVYMSAKDSLVRMVSRLVPPKEIEDIVQETYVRICQLGQHQTIEQPKSFLMKTARNLAFDHLKRSETRLAQGVEDEDEFSCYETASDGTFDQVANREEFSYFCEAVRQLPTQCRRVFVLKKVYGYSQKEIASELNISQSTVEKHISVGLRQCTGYMLEMGQLDISVSKNKENKAKKVTL